MSAYGTFQENLKHIIQISAVTATNIRPIFEPAMLHDLLIYKKDRREL